MDRDKGMEMRDIWKGEMSKAVSELQREYDDQLAAIRADCEMRMESQVGPNNAIKSVKFKAMSKRLLLFLAMVFNFKLIDFIK